MFKKAQYIITRIKNKAATSSGLTGGVASGIDQKDVGPSVQAFKPLSPTF